jgi:hypothetical protein
LVSPEDQGTIMAHLDLDNETIGTEATIDTFVQVHEVMIRIGQYSQPVRTVQAVCDHPCQIIAPQKQITDQQTK